MTQVKRYCIAVIRSSGTVEVLPHSFPDRERAEDYRGRCDVWFKGVRNVVVELTGTLPSTEAVQPSSLGELFETSAARGGHGR
ncbi:MAG TPA: hypothetical protein VEJ63_05870 [Planctomycetota bacterium]|nr:hypothetical protein [Planctomycetota bacterium]